MPDFSGGGAEGVFIQLANFFSKKNNVHFMVLNKSGPNILKLEKNIKIVELNKKSSLKSIKKRDLNSKLVRRRGRVYIINKTNPKFKARQK